jgi:hypothetical protein
MPGDIVATVSAVIALAALAITLWQNTLTRRAMQAQVFLTLKQLADAVPYDEGLDAIATLNDYNTYEDYLATEPVERRQLINNTIKFLNYAAHLANKKYLPRQHIWDLYFWGYRIARQKLCPWWLEGVRKNEPRRFTRFESMCERVSAITDRQIMEWHKWHERSNMSRRSEAKPR